MPRKQPRWVNLKDIRPGPIVHAEGFRPFEVAWLRDLYARAGRYVQPTFEQWELGFTRDHRYQLEIMCWEAIACTAEEYLEVHPDADKRNAVLASACVSIGPLDEENEQSRELRVIFQRRWEWQRNNSEAFARAMIEKYSAEV